MTKRIQILCSEDLRLLADIGFMAGSRKLDKHASAIFKAIRALRPEHEVSFLGEAMVKILKGDPSHAIEVLKDAPVTIATQTFLGIAHVQNGDVTKGRTILDRIARAEEQTPISQMARDALQNIEPERTGRHGDFLPRRPNSREKFDPVRGAAKMLAS